MNRCSVKMLRVVGLVAFLASAAWCRAYYEAVPIQLALWSPVQLFSVDRDVVGLRLDFIYGANENVSGLDIGLWNETIGSEHGVQVGGVNVVGSECVGLQYGVVNLVNETMTGWQGGLFNMVNDEVHGLQTGSMNLGLTGVRGLQIGVVNYAQDMSGLQIGLFNAVQVMYGVQIGLINIISDKEILPVLPVINAAF